MAGIKSVKLNTGQRVQVGSKAYGKYTASGSTPVSGTGRNLTPKDIKGIGGGFQTESVGDKYKRIRPELGGSPDAPAPTFGQPIDTSQPSPATTQIQPPNQGLAPGLTKNPDGTINYSGKAGTSTFNPKTGVNKYQQAHQQLQAQGTPVTANAGQDKMLAGQAVGAFDQTQPVSPLGGLMETDTNFDSIFTNLDKYMEPLQQRKSLVDEYKVMSKELGIQNINAELLEIKNVIDGSEDTIRAEISASGGTANNLQVMLMSAAANKVLMKNYNTLLSSRDNAMQQLSTMMSLTMEDRRAAESEFDRKMDFAFKVADFKQKAVDRSTSQLNTLVNNIGYGGLLAATNGNAYEQSVIERTLGLGAGGLAKAAAYVPSISEMEKLQLDEQKLRNQKFRKDLLDVPAITPEQQKVADDAVKRKTEVSALAKELLDKDAVGKDSAVGASIAKFIPFGQSLGLQGNRSAFENKVNTLKSNLTLDNLKLLKGSMSDKDLLFLNSIGSSLSTDMSQKEFDKELQKIINKLDESGVGEKTDDDPLGLGI